MFERNWMDLEEADYDVEHVPSQIDRNDSEGAS